MNQWSFVIVAYAVAILGTAALLIWAFFAMRLAEGRAELLKERQ
jgi:hypothetical protein